jgi:hypothetical protein
MGPDSGAVARKKSTDLMATAFMGWISIRLPMIPITLPESLH